MREVGLIRNRLVSSREFRLEQIPHAWQQDLDNEKYCKIVNITVILPNFKQGLETDSALQNDFKCSTVISPSPCSHNYPTAQQR